MHAVPFTLLLAASSSGGHVARVAAAVRATGSPGAAPPSAVDAPAATTAPPASPPAPLPGRALPAPTASASAAPASTAPGATASGAPALRPFPRDRAANLIGGVWQCETIAGSTGTHTYTQNEDDGSIELTTELHAGYRTFHIRESYSYDDARKLWTARTEGDAYSGTAPPWTGYKWTFEGTAQERGQRRAVRMIYFDLADQAFRRDFQAKQDGTWQTYSAETCKRPSS